jgi:hypothetical protein
MTRFADNIARIRVIEIAGDLVGGPHEKHALHESVQR